MSAGVGQPFEALASGNSIKKALCIGLMSGTSLDGVDGVLLDLAGPGVHVLAQASLPFEPTFRAELLSLNIASYNELHRAALAGNRIAAAYAQVVHQLIQQAQNLDLNATDVLAIGAHGQTVRHQPQRWSEAAMGAGYTLQLNNPALLAELTGITVVADFRSRDVAAGGQGAPLVPAFHQQVFSQPGVTVAVLNLGGIANLSVLPGQASDPVLGFDCGPGNALMDAWCLQQTGQPFDQGGAWAASGQCLPDLLARLLDEPYFSQPLPKSTGRDLFNSDWLQDKLQGFTNAPAQDVQATLTELTASACADCISSYAKESKRLIVCGGGAFNHHLLQRLQAHLAGIPVSTSDQDGLPPLEVEAAAFAWLAYQTMHHKPGNLPSVTGAAGRRILGAIYPA
ncbi:anhydro-N-acetylmuramic acid kinase [Rhodoferax antarcticus ANT.BR]|uniref:Anhydro-N-acetylmuramic acid kinase n=1 Tax=Rhodoferax antarcticus ANT.BR TaxID=1111071 RepID=A0A1Q8YCL0_9BURK|nr:anhydro-N-acetylmuramic acid kinase [Rhodoferax antarcticus]OLP05743.1 anhydro-N-acetylmuramic acid kinase [Rhodoferax antarcticus ANT.BR]